jgi:hypothetical protein
MVLLLLLCQCLLSPITTAAWASTTLQPLSHILLPLWHLLYLLLMSQLFFCLLIMHLLLLYL